jgi:hypothetical protein
MSTNLLQQRAQRTTASRSAVEAKAEHRREDQARTAAWQAHRDSVEGDRTVPTYKVPSGRFRLTVRGTCQYCHGTVFDLFVAPVDLDRPHVSRQGEVFCMLCGRNVAHLVIGEGAPRILTCACGRQFPVHGDCRPCRKRAAQRRAERAYRDRQQARRTEMTP